MTIPSKTFVSRFLHDECSPRSGADIIISDMIKAFCGSDLRLVVWWSTTSRSNRLIVDFVFEMIINVSIAKEINYGSILNLDYADV